MFKPLNVITKVALRRSRLRSRLMSPAARPFITNAAYKMAKKMMPKISETERVALGCGTVVSEKPDPLTPVMR